MRQPFSLPAAEAQPGPAVPRRVLLASALALPALLPPGKAAAQAVRWNRLPGAAFDVGADGGQVFVIGRNPSAGGYGIYRWNGQTSGNAWDVLPGSATDITVDRAGNPWVVNAANNIYRWNGNRFDHLPGKATDIGAGGGQVFVIGTDRVPGGYGIYRFNGANGWDRVPGGAVRIAADRQGNPWVVNDRGEIFVWNRGRFDLLPGRAMDIACGGNEVYVIGTNPLNGGFGIYRWLGTSAGQPWQNVGGAAIRVAVDPKGLPWVVNEAGGIYKA